MGYTLWHGKTYEEWADEKARRIRDVLRFLYLRGLPIDFQMLASKVYRERLLGVPKIKWKPFDNRFLDKKPSPFIKNFLAFLVFRLKEDGFLRSGWTIELMDVARATDSLMLEGEGGTRTPIRISYEHRLVGLPSLEWLVDVCTWTDPTV